MANESKSIDYTVMIADLQTKRAAIDAAIMSLVAASGAMVPVGDGSVSYAQQADSRPVELPRGAFLGKSLPAAVKLYLSAVVKKKTIKEIATALREGGVESTSDNFEGVITGCVHRMKSNGELLQFKDGWALAEFYPQHIRASLSQQTGAKGKAAKKKATKTHKNPKSAKTAPSASQKPVSADGLEQRIESFALAHQGEWVTFKDVANALPGTLPSVVSLTLGRMAKKRGWEKNEEGKYHFGGSNVQEMPKAV
jgi:hypothetical protein